jgi:hypothetical protein
MQQSKLVGGLVIVALIAGAFWVSRRPPPPRVTRANFERIHPGMTQAEVEAVLGPPGFYHNGRGRLDPAVVKKVEAAAGSRFRLWFGEAGFVGVEFDEAGRVLNSTFIPMPPPGIGRRE